MISGCATPEGTARYRDRFIKKTAEGHFRRFGELWLSSIGLGTYLGEADAVTDRGYEEAILEALSSGCNVLDSAINYRHQRSERSVGRALARAIEEGSIARDELFVSTKAGFVPFDGQLPTDPGGYLGETYFASGLLSGEEFVGGCHAMPPRFLADQLERSRANLGLEEVDLFYLHNPETQFESLPTEEAENRLRAALTWLEETTRAGAIGCYGLATWTAFRSPPGTPGHLVLEEIVRLAIEVAGDGRPRFKAVQLPLNLAMPEALAAPTQELDGVGVPALIAAQKLNVAVFTSASILQGRLSRGLPPEIAEVFPDLVSDAQRALQFTRSAPGVTTALVGMSSTEHVEENLGVAAIEPAVVEAFRALF
jgi:aryl-alcohol dehydrogenase-like predicted oxidoreductase